MLIAQSTIVGAILDLWNCKFLRSLRNSCELIQILVILRTGPNLDLPSTMLWTGLYDVDIVTLDDLIRVNCLHALWTKCIGFTDLLCHAVSIVFRKYNDSIR